MRPLVFVLLLLTAAPLAAQPTPNPTPQPGQRSSLYLLLNAATAAVTPVPAFVPRNSRPAFDVCIGATCTGLTLNPECSLDGVTYGPMDVDGAATIVHGDLTVSTCTVFAVDQACRWFRVRNPTVNTCTHSVRYSHD